MPKQIYSTKSIYKKHQSTLTFEEYCKYLTPNDISRVVEVDSEGDNATEKVKELIESGHIIIKSISYDGCIGLKKTQFESLVSDKSRRMLEAYNTYALKFDVMEVERKLMKVHQKRAKELKSNLHRGSAEYRELVVLEASIGVTRTKLEKLHRLKGDTDG